MATDDLSELKLDTDALYREDVFTDRRVGTVQRLTPVQADGSDDDARPVRYLGQTQVMTPVGALPLSFELEADTLRAALDQFPKAAHAALERTMEELKEMQRESASGILTPGQGGGGHGGMPGGGIQLR